MEQYDYLTGMKAVLRAKEMYVRKVHIDSGGRLGTVHVLRGLGLKCVPPRQSETRKGNSY